MSIQVQIDDQNFLKMLVNRLLHWTDDLDTIALYEKAWESRMANKFYHNIEFDILQIVDNDYVNWTLVVDEKHNMFHAVLEAYENHLESYDILAVDNEFTPTKFLIAC